MPDASALKAILVLGTMRRFNELEHPLCVRKDTRHSSALSIGRSCNQNEKADGITIGLFQMPRLSDAKTGGYWRSSEARSTD